MTHEEDAAQVAEIKAANDAKRDAALAQIEADTAKACEEVDAIWAQVT